MKKFALLLLLLIFPLLDSYAASGSGCVSAEESKRLCDSLSVRLEQRGGVKIKCGLKSIKRVHKKKNQIDLYFKKEFGDYPFRAQDINWLRRELKQWLPATYAKCKIRNIYVGKLKLEELVVYDLPSDGKAAKSKFKLKKAPSPQNPLVYRESEPRYKYGLEGRHIALWNSHGLYFNAKHYSWLWQRAPLFGTLEDLFTSSYVLPYLVPMLENAGAVVMLPRERDLSNYEYIIDNDSSATSRPSALPKMEGNWTVCSQGFADTKETYTGTDNPFSMGTAVSIKSSKKANASITWESPRCQKGRYAIYISYASLPESCRQVHYVVHHRGGSSHFRINQKMGGGTWIYLGDFDWDEHCRVVLDNGCKEKGIITADAVKIGGGMGNIERERLVSGKARFAEGARYWLQWAGADSTVYSQNRDSSDYRDDFMSRGAWVAWLSGGSRANPGLYVPPKTPDDKPQTPRPGKAIPIDLSLAFHTNAGIHGADSTYGTLAIYTLKCEKSQILPSGENRLCQREFADLVQTQLVDDIRRSMHPQWRRKGLWNRSYSESRTPQVPAMLLELLSHQNYNDMKLGLDPHFKFLASRSVYKGILKYLSARYGVNYIVQPLPVRSFSALLTKDDCVELSWKETVDSLEPTAQATHFLLQRRVDDGCFDNGEPLIVSADEQGVYRHRIALEKGHRYAFRIMAYNQGGKSFPSEILSIGLHENSTDTALIVNNFTRFSGPAYQDGEERASFDYHRDSGVPYLSDFSYIGDMYENRRVKVWEDDHCPGFGASYTDYAGKIRGGNRLDYPAMHGKELFDLGYSYASSSISAFEEDSVKAYSMIDLICGKQTRMKDHQNKLRYEVFSHKTREKLSQYSQMGCNLLVSGSYIASDLWDGVFMCDTSTANQDAQKFVKEVLGYRYMTGRASKSGEIRAMHAGMDAEAQSIRKTFHICMDMCDSLYRIESPDGIVPASPNGHTIYRYTDNNISAAVAHQGNGYRAISFGFPLESIMEREKLHKIFVEITNYFNK
ncbi:MAG: xanthan lyase [Bacteroidales bacterium]|nr:xanthan lyase [Bacteroidales bacterium]MBQ1937921.1 xanthan lyase [Bacteroidales bacterium]